MHCFPYVEQEGVYGTNSHPLAYSPTHKINQSVPVPDHQGYPPPYQDQYSGYPPPPYTPDGAVSQGKNIFGPLLQNFSC